MDEHVRIEAGLESGTILSALVTPASADALARGVTAGSSGTVALETEDGNILIVVPRVLYLRRFAREGRVGFDV
jgi:hypothetical protein